MAEAAVHLMESLVSDSSTLELMVYAREFALPVWRAAGIPATDWLEVHRDCRSADASAVSYIAEWLVRNSINVVVTATGGEGQEQTDRAIWLAARRCGIPSHVVMDRMVLVEERFQGRDGEFVRPDFVHVPSEEGKRLLEELGFSPESVRVVGPLHLDRVKRLQSEAREKRAELREAWGASPDDRVVLYASEPVRETEVFLKGRSPDEFRALECLIDMIRDDGLPQEIAGDPARSLVVIRPHPRDSKNKYLAYEASTFPRVLESSSGTPVEVALAVDAVMGMNSSLLYEAEAMGVLAFSLVETSPFQRKLGPRLPAPPCKSKTGSR
ncbi:MAG: hypothetical protein RID42_07605 [Alphaproteobacteria bacterium]